VAVLDDDLRKACLGALELATHPSDTNMTPRSFALDHSWRACTQQFLAKCREGAGELTSPAQRERTDRCAAPVW